MRRVAWPDWSLATWDCQRPERVVPMIVFKESMTTRRRVARLADLFASYETARI